MSVWVTADEDFEMAVKALNGRLYPDPLQRISTISSRFQANDILMKLA